MTDVPSIIANGSAIANGGVIASAVGVIAALLRANLLKDKLVNELVKDMLEATKAGARADYAVAAALQRIEQKMGLAPSNAGAPATVQPPAQAGGQP